MPGHHHVGLTAGAKSGRLVAQMVCGRPPEVDMAPYDGGRGRIAGRADVDCEMD